MNNTNKQAVTSRFTGAVTGISKHITGNVTVGGVAYTPVTLSEPFSAALTAITAADKLHKQWLDAVKAAEAAVASATVVYRPFKQFVIGQFGANQTVLDDFGISVPKAPAVPSAATKAAAALKAKATREARGTTGKKQKQQVKGHVQVDITAVPVVTTPAHEPAPAPVASAAPAALPAAVSAKPSAG